MSVFRIAWRSIQHRGLGSLLTIISMALGVMTVVAVLTIHGVVSRSFHANSSFGYDVIIGSRGGSMQLTLNTVYYLSKPLEPIPFEYYLAFLPQEAREPFIKNSIAYRAHEAQQASLAMVDALVGGLGVDAGQAWTQAACRSAEQELALDQMTIRAKGDYADWAEVVIPLTLGDSFSRDLDDETGGFRVVEPTAISFPNSYWMRNPSANLNSHKVVRWRISIPRMGISNASSAAKSLKLVTCIWKKPSTQFTALRAAPTPILMNKASR